MRTLPRTLVAALTILCLVLMAGGVTAAGARHAGAAQDVVHLTWMIPTQQATTVGDSAAIQMIEKKFNVQFTFTEAPPGAVYDQKKQLVIASQNIPDLMSWVNRDEANLYGPQGAFLELTPYLTKELSGLARKLASDPSGKYNAYNAQGKLYYAPQVYAENLPIFDVSYMKDAFASVGAGPAQLRTWDQIYAALTKLKATYPTSYPIVFRGKDFSGIGGGTMLRNVVEESFTAGKAAEGATFQDDAVSWDYDGHRWIFGPAAPGFKDAIQFLAKLYADKLIDPEYLTTDMNGLLHKLDARQGFMTTDFVGGLSGVDSLNAKARHQLMPLQLPSAPGMRQIVGVAGHAIGTVGTTLSSKLSGDKLARALQVLNYLYSSEFYNYLYWNPAVTRASTHTYIPAIYKNDLKLVNKYLPWSLTALFQVNYDTVTAPGTAYSAYVQHVYRDAVGTSKFVPASPVLPFTTAQTKQMKILQTQVDTLWASQIDQFVTGKMSLDQWAPFIAQLRARGADQLVSIYNTVYQQAYGKK